MSFANQEIVPKLGGWIRPIVYGAQYNKKVVDEHIQATSKVLGVLEQHLLVHTFLVGERLTLADMFAASLVSRGFANVSGLRSLYSLSANQLPASRSP